MKLKVSLFGIANKSDIIINPPIPEGHIILEEKVYKKSLKDAVKVKELEMKIAHGEEKAILQKEINDLKSIHANLPETLNKAQEKITILESALKLEGGKIKAGKLAEAYAALQMGDFSKAKDLFIQIKNHTELEEIRSARASFALGQIAEQELRWYESAEHHARAAMLYPCFETLITAQELAFNIGNYDSALSLGLDAKKAAIKDYGEESEQHARAINDLATLYKQKAQYKDAELLYNKALAIRKKVFGKSHPAVAITLNNLASVYHLQGDYETAELLYQKAIEINRKELGENNPATANNLNNLADLYRLQGQYDKAEPLFKSAIKSHRLIFGDMHPSTATSLNNLALLYDGMERYEESEELYDESLTICREVLGDNHPDTANSFNNLGGLYFTQGQYEKAEPFCRQALEIFEVIFGPDHPNTKSTKQNYEALKARLPNAENDEPQ